VVKNLIGVYRALGGGWIYDEDQPETLTSAAVAPTPPPATE
jgi:hypothetical protein